jgi:hypothetical protein
MCRHRRCWSSSMVCIMSTPIPHARTSKSSCFSRVRRDRTRTGGASRGWRTVHLGRFGAVNCVSQKHKRSIRRFGAVNCFKNTSDRFVDLERLTVSRTQAIDSSIGAVVFVSLHSVPNGELWPPLLYFSFNMVLP